MPFKFNPFSGNFDQTGSGGGASYIDGEEATYNDLSLDAGVAPLNSAWLVRNSSGIWPFNKPGGIYIRTATGGSSRDSDYTYAGTMPDVFSDAVLTIYDEASTTRTGQFNLGSVTAGQNRVLTWPNANGTIARTQDFAAPPAIGNTTAAAANFTTVGATGAITGAEATVTSVRSLANGFQLPVASSSGAVGILSTFIAGNNELRIYSANSGGTISNMATFNASSGASFAALSATGTTELVNGGTTAGPFRVYNTFTSATNFERGFMRWSSNVLQIGTEKGSGGGLARALEFQVDGSSYLDLNNGLVRIMNNRDLTWQARCRLRPLSTTSGVLGLLDDTGGNPSVRFCFEGFTSSFPCLKRSSTTLQVRLANDSDFAPLECAGLTLNGNLTASTRNIVTDTTTGTKIGTATDQKLGFWNATPVIQQSSTGTNATGFTANGPTNTVHADSTFTGDVGATAYSISDIVKHLKTMGLIAS